MCAEEYWLAQPGVETRIRASDHLFYPRQHLPRLEAAIRRLHALVCDTPCAANAKTVASPPAMEGSSEGRSKRWEWCHMCN